MCFSASASFGAGVILSTIGVITIRKAKNPRQIGFASIPLIFAVQQISEGFLWLALTDPIYSPLRHGMTFVFLFFAQVVWPIWVPVSLLVLTEKEDRNAIQKVLVLIGAIVSVYLGYCLLSYPVEAKDIGKHIMYQQDYPAALGRFGGLLYVMATVLPPLFSPIKRMWMLSLAIFISYIITTIFYEDYIVSVWCFFASIISISVLALVYQMNSRPEKPIINQQSVS